MAGGSELERVLEEAVRLEEEQARGLEELAGRLPHPILRAILRGVAFDSRKHAEFYRAVLEAVRGRVGLLTREDMELLRSAIGRHVEAERRMLELVERVASGVGDERSGMLLEAVRREEELHHDLLRAVEGYVGSREVYDEEEFWETVWRESRWASRHRVTGPRAGTG